LRTPPDFLPPASILSSPLSLPLFLLPIACNLLDLLANREGTSSRENHILRDRIDVLHEECEQQFVRVIALRSRVMILLGEDLAQIHEEFLPIQEPFLNAG
jgi:hypothetical protein